MQLWYGDCLDLMKDIPSGSVDMVLCDLPYGTTQNKWDAVIPFEPLWEQYWRIAKRNAAIVLTAQCPFDKLLGASQIKYLKYEWIWEKGKATGHLNAKKQPMKAHENVLVYYREQCVYNPQGTVEGIFNSARPAKDKKKNDNYGSQSGQYSATKVGNYPRSVVGFSGEHNPTHPTQKPVALMEYLIRTYTNEGETVLDNCMGSGTTGVACVNTNRNFIGIEKDTTYFQIAKDRINKAAKAKPS